MRCQEREVLPWTEGKRIMSKQGVEVTRQRRQKVLCGFSCQDWSLQSFGTEHPETWHDTGQRLQKQLPSDIRDSK